MTEETRRLTRELAKVNENLEDIKEALRTERRRAWWHRAMSALIGVIVVAMLLFWRQDRIRECESANAARADIRHAITETVLAIAERSDSFPPDELAELIDRIQARLLQTIPDRSCDLGVLP